MRIPLIASLLVPIILYMFSRLFSAFKSAAPTVLLGPATQPTTSTALHAQQTIRSMATTNGAAGISAKEDFGTFALGCFWGSEHMYRKYYTGKGLLDAKVGYIGGKDSSKDPSYQEVCSGRTGHAEAVLVKFDPSQVSYAELVEFFYRIHDPTTKDRQGADRGTQYRSAIFAHSPEQMATAKKVTEEVQEKHFTSAGKKIVTIIEERPVSAFFEGESYHQKYLENNPSGYECPNHRLWW